MADKTTTMTSAASKARADSIRRARDKRNASLAAPPDAVAACLAIRPHHSDRGPNYVDFVDRKMRAPEIARVQS